MATLLDIVRSVTKSTTTETTDQSIVNFLNMGARYCASSIPKRLLLFWTNQSSAVSDDNGHAVNYDRIVEVVRDSISCDEVDPKLAYYLTLTDSLYKATSRHPKWYFRNGRIYVKPAPSGSENAYIYTIQPPTITSTTDETDDDLKQLANPIINYACGCDYLALSGYWSMENTDLIGSSGDAEDALTKAKNLIDGTETENNVEDWIDDEDSEMANAVVQAAAQEVNRAIAEMQMGKEFNAESKDNINKAFSHFKLADNDIRLYIASDEEIMTMQMLQQRREER